MPILDGGKMAKTLSGSMVENTEKTAIQDAELYDADVYLPAGRGKAATLELAARSCGAAGCAGGWIAPWRSRRRPIFEEEWGCSGHCLKTMVRASMRREMGQGSGLAVDAPHPHRVPLGLVLLAQGWITHPQLQRALVAQRTAGGRIGELLVQTCGLDEERVTRGLGVQWSCPVLALNGFSPSAMALTMPKRFVAEFGLVPLRVAGSTLLYLAFADRMNAGAAHGVEQMSGLKVESGLLSGSQFEMAKKAVLEADAVPLTMETVADADEACNWLTKALEKKQPMASRLVRVHQYYWMRIWLEGGAMSGVGTLPRGTADVQDYLVSVKDARG
jgi:hypothetical protein